MTTPKPLFILVALAALPAAVNPDDTPLHRLQPGTKIVLHKPVPIPQGVDWKYYEGQKPFVIFFKGKPGFTWRGSKPFCIVSLRADRTEPIPPRTLTVTGVDVDVIYPYHDYPDGRHATIFHVDDDLVGDVSCSRWVTGEPEPVTLKQARKAMSAKGWAEIIPAFESPRSE